MQSIVGWLRLGCNNHWVLKDRAGTSFMLDDDKGAEAPPSVVIVTIDA
jgi:hypothetical protein